MFRSKRGVIDDAGFWIIRILLIFVVVAAVVFFVNSIILRSIDVGSLEQDLIASRIINSQHCLAYQDSSITNRVSPGIVDITSYDADYLKNNCIITENKELVGVMVKITGREPIYLNKEYYEDTEPLTFAKKYHKSRKVIPVIFENRKETDPTQGILEVVVVGEKR